MASKDSIPCSRHDPCECAAAFFHAWFCNSTCTFAIQRNLEKGSLLIFSCSPSALCQRSGLEGLRPACNAALIVPAAGPIELRARPVPITMLKWRCHVHRVSWRSSLEMLAHVWVHWSTCSSGILMIGSAVGPYVNAITVVVHALLPANGVVSLMLFLICFCCAKLAHCAWWPYDCTGWVPAMVISRATGVSFTSALVRAPRAFAFFLFSC